MVQAVVGEPYPDCHRTPFKISEIFWKVDGDF
ncbi:MAG: hypothetical protein AVDCRST_MAG93-3641 [uncultured Chloroflexia bacterium]|uniref:Uncharacterized protein n=1 Tax=uncultured Chloroflexia bacterium TaxID=1672391 RepID=A0A6J4JTW4_9CHLR|nr:MAG: hypothetical protein AVDCRST_MAG93-3641 [uncultured Chloroflexia bacterium]